MLKKNIDLSTTVHDGAAVLSGRIKPLDGLRGVAAMIVVVFHILCLLYPFAVPSMTPGPIYLADTPIGILWNGPFAVSIFFVLSGFVIAAAAERRREMLVTNIITRYFRLAVPVCASVMLAWALLSLFPIAAMELGKVVSEPSRWLNYTYQGEIPSLSVAVMDGLVTNFLRGKSDFNNVLWTMRIELIGSIGIFFIYWVCKGKTRITFLALSSIALSYFLYSPYVAFTLGALLYEAYVRGILKNIGKTLPYFALIVGIVLGAAGQGATERLDLPVINWRLLVGDSKGLVPVFSATLIIFAVISLPGIGRIFSTPLPQWLGRISFALYLVHVPLLYTLVAATYVRMELSLLVLIPAYFGVTLALAHIFTIGVDEPALRLLKRIRLKLQRCDVFFKITRAT